MMALLLRILTIVSLMEMGTASGISEIERRDREIEKQPECPWSHFGSRINSIETDLKALTHKIDTLTYKSEALAEKMDRALDRKECHSGFDYLPGIDQCLKLNTDVMTWAQAHAACRRMAKGGQLVTITDSAKQDAVKRYLEKQFSKPETAVCIIPEWAAGGKSVWIGGQRKIPNSCDTPFVWKYKQGVEVPFAFTKWISGQPDCAGNGEHCAHTGSGLYYSWNDIPCAWSLCSVCEI